MMPDLVLSTTPVPAPFLPPDDRPFELLRDFEFGGVALQDPTQGLQVKVWTFRLSGDDVIVSDDVADTVLFTRAGITEIAGCFDQNMNPCVAFMQDGVMTLWWFDTVAGEQVFTTYDDGSVDPRVCMDDKRSTQSAASDIVFVYVRAGNLYMRQQRDRFDTEYALTSGGEIAGYQLRRAGMNTVLRLQFSFFPLPTP